MSKAPKISLADRAILQQILKRTGSLDTILDEVKSLSINEDKTVYGYGYTRVSDPRTDPESLMVQEELVRKYAKEIGVTILHVYSDYGLSGGLPAEKRVGFMNMLLQAQPGQFILANRSDRLFRDRDEKKKVRDWLSAKSVKIRAPDYIDEDEFNKAAQLPNEIVDVVNEHYRHLTAEKVKKGLRQRSADGTLRSKPWYGWKFNGKDKPWAKVEYEQNARAKIKELKAANPKMTISMIIEELIKADFKYAREYYNEDGTVKKQSKWCYAVVKSILDRIDIDQN